MSDLRDRSEFYFTLAAMEEAGLPPSTALKRGFLGRFRPAALRLSAAVSGGSSISEAMSQDALFSRFECVFVAAGERNGRLPSVLRSLGEWFALRRASRQSLVGGLLYPLFLYYFAGLVFTLIDWLASSGCSPWLLGRLVVWCLFPPALLLLIRLLAKATGAWTFPGRLLDLTPVLGELAFRRETMLFFKTLAMCLSSGLGMTDSLDYASMVCQTAFYRERYGALAAMVEQTACPLSDAFTRLGMTRREERSLIMPCLLTGEQSGTLAESCERLAERQREDHARLLKGLCTALPIIVYLAIAAYIGFKVISFYAGYVSMINGLM